MINKIYDIEFRQALECLSDSKKEHINLRILFKKIIDSIKYTSYVENKTQHIVQLTNVDKEFVEMRSKEFLNITEIKIVPYSETDIIKTVSDNVEIINNSIFEEIEKIKDIYQSMGQEPKFPCELISIEKLRENNLK